MKGWARIILVGIGSTFLLISVISVMARGTGHRQLSTIITVCPAGCDYTHIQEAIDAAFEQDVIQVFAGTYTETITISKTLTVQGAGMDETHIDGGGLGRVVSILGNSAVTLTDVTIAHGLAPADNENDAYGGGLLNEGTLLFIRGRISENIVAGGDAQLPDVSSGHAHGAGLYNACGDGFCGQATLIDSILNGNTAQGGTGRDDAGDENLAAGGNTFGGGIYNAGGAFLVMTNTQFISNTLIGGEGFSDFGSTVPGGQAAGGGIYNQGTAILSQTTISGNLAFGGDENYQGGTTGGGLFNGANAQVTGREVAIINNQLHGGDSYNFYNQSSGGGVYIDGVATFYDSNISGNKALSGYFNLVELVFSQGGGIFNTGTLLLNTSTIHENYASDGIIDLGYTRNKTPGLGGGIYSRENFTISASDLSTNLGGDGAGIHVGSGKGEIISSTINGNLGMNCAGISSQGTLTITYSSISGNIAAGEIYRFDTAGRGGGICNEGVMNISWSDISLNQITSGGGAENDRYGGGIANMGDLKIAESAIHHNSASAFGYYSLSAFGGGIYHDNGGGQLALINSTISQNALWLTPEEDDVEGETGGSGIYIHGAASGKLVNMQNVTISGNNITLNGPGDWVVGGGGIMDNATDLVQVVNSIVANNSPEDCSGGIVSLGHNLSSDTSCSFNAAGDMSNTNPLLGALQDNGGPTLTQALLGISPAVDAGDDALCPVIDQRGFPRPVDGDNDGSFICDIGAFETNWIPPLFLPVIHFAPPGYGGGN